MLSDIPFGHNMIRNYVIAFGTLFNNIKITRPVQSTATQTIGVPLSYAPKHAFLRSTINPNLDAGVSTVLPRMSFDLASMNYAPERKLNTINRVVTVDNSSNTSLYNSYTPVPYDLNFSLYIYVKNVEDGTSIVEQILPFFTPELTVSLKEDPKTGIGQDIPVVLSAVNVEDNYESGLETQRTIIWSLDFVLRGNLYGPVYETGLINKVFINIHPTTNTALHPVANNYEQVYLQPGISSSTGLPTTNADASVAVSQIQANGTYGFAQKIFTWQDYE